MLDLSYYQLYEISYKKKDCWNVTTLLTPKWEDSETHLEYEIFTPLLELNLFYVRSINSHEMCIEGGVLTSFDGFVSVVSSIWV